MKRQVLGLFLIGMVIVAGIAMPSYAQDDGADEIWGRGVVQEVDKTAGKIVLRHEPIPDIGWPEMTMRFAVVDGVSLDDLGPDAQVDFSLVPRADGQFFVNRIKVSQ